MRFRVSYQHDSMQCGAACLRMVCKHYGKEYALDFLSEQCGCMIDGVSLQAIRETAEDLGFRTFAVSVGLSELQAGWCPCILHWERNHFVVLYRIHKDKYHVADPAKGTVIYRKEDFLKRYNLPDKPIIAIVPGSRKSEIKNNLMIMEQAAASHTDYQIVVAGAPGIDLQYYGYYITPGTPIIPGATFELMHHAKAALVTSGTATLECALLNTPQVVCYRSNGNKLSYQIMEKILKVPFVSLPNLIANRRIVPEMLMHRCTPALVGKELSNILPGRPGYDNQREGYRLMREILGDSEAATTTASAIYSAIRPR